MKCYREIPNSNLASHDMEFFTIKTNNVKLTASAHIHTAVEILYILEGSFQIEVNDTKSEANAGDLVIIPSNEIHSVYHFNNEAGSYQVLKLSSQILMQTFIEEENSACILPFIKKQIDTEFIYSSNNLPEEIHQTIKFMMTEAQCRKSMYFPMIKSQAFALIIQMYRAFFSEKKVSFPHVKENTLLLIYQSVGYINENYASDISSAQCAKMINLSYSYYAKTFRDVIGKSFTEYLIDLRLAKAHKKLMLNNSSVTEVAISCGYRNMAHFAAEYKKHYGITPSETHIKNAYTL